MTVKVTGSDHVHQWYRNRIGELFEVIEHLTDKAWWEVTEREQPHITRLIKKEHAQFVKP